MWWRMVLVLGLVCVSPSSVDAQATRCREYASQADAQAAYRENPIALANLDAEQDGWACESNPAPYDCEPIPPEQRRDPNRAPEQPLPPRGCR
jgi:hypothetical protein